MAFRIDKAVVRGEISNQERGVVTGKIWLADRKEPLRLRLQGNCLRDLAGCELRFVNPTPLADPSLAVLAPEQNGVAGDLTASRKIRQPTISDEEVVDLMEKQQPIPHRVANCLYLEWYSEENGRVVIESCEYSLVVSAPDWMMSAEEEGEQLGASHHHFHQFIDAITGDAAAGDGEEGEGSDLPDEPVAEAAPAGGEVDGPADRVAEGEPLNEFEWEQELRDADRRAEAYQEAFEKYRDHPDRERLIAEALGWDDGDDDDDTEEFIHLENDEGGEDAMAWEPEMDDMEPHHPLSQRAMDFALALQREAEERGLMGDHAETRDSPILALILHIISLGGKLAGALDGWAQGLDPEPGFIIAMLKRAQVPLNEALHAFDCIDASSLTEETRLWLQTRKRDLFELRREIIDLMHELRAD